MITWLAWPNLIIIVFHVSRFSFPESLLDLFRHTAITHSPVRTTLALIFYTFLYFINIGKLITYHSWILWSRPTHSCFSHPQLQKVCDCNIQPFQGWWCHLWLQSSWHTSSLLSCYVEYLDEINTSLMIEVYVTKNKKIVKLKDYYVFLLNNVESTLHNKPIEKIQRNRNRLKLMDDTFTSLPKLCVNSIIKNRMNSHINVVAQLSKFVNRNKENKQMEQMYISR